MQTETSQEDKKARNIGGRPSTFTVEMADRICERISSGRTLNQVCRDPDIPAASTIRAWRRKNPAFDSQYAAAREDLYAHWAAEIVDIADDGTTDYITKIGRNGREYQAVDQEHIQRSRLRVDTRRWLLSKLVPATYGDHVELEVGGSVTVQHELSDRERMRRMALFLLEDQAAGGLIEGQAEAIPAELEPDKD